MTVLERPGLRRICTLLTISGGLIALQRQLDDILQDNLAATMLSLFVAIIALTWIGPLLSPPSRRRGS